MVVDETHLDGTEVIGGEQSVGPAALPGDVEIDVDSFVVLHDEAGELVA